MNYLPYRIQRFKRCGILQKRNLVKRSEEPDIENLPDFTKILTEFACGLEDLSLSVPIDFVIRISTQPSLVGDSREGCQSVVKWLSPQNFLMVLLPRSLTF
jgi:hypothetical protein